MTEDIATQNVLACNDCGQVKKIDEFPKNRWGFTKVCKDCRLERKLKAKAPATRIKDAEKLGFVIKTRAYVCCPKCGEVVGQVDSTEE